MVVLFGMNESWSKVHGITSFLTFKLTIYSNSGNQSGVGLGSVLGIKRV